MDERVYEHAVEQNKDRVFGYARLVLRDRMEAQDVAQEALVRLWQHHERVEPEAARAWLLRTAHRLCIDRLRRRSARAEVGDGDEVLCRQSDPGPGPDRRTGAVETGRGVARALETLSEADRVVVILREIEELPYEEIASMLQLPLGTLKARLHRARERLRAALVRAGVTP